MIAHHVLLLLTLTSGDESYLCSSKILMDNDLQVSTFNFSDDDSTQLKSLVEPQDHAPAHLLADDGKSYALHVPATPVQIEGSCGSQEPANLEAPSGVKLTGVFVLLGKKKPTTQVLWYPATSVPSWTPTTAAFRNPRVHCLKNPPGTTADPIHLDTYSMSKFKELISLAVYSDCDYGVDTLSLIHDPSQCQALIKPSKRGNDESDGGLKSTGLESLAGRLELRDGRKAETWLILRASYTESRGYAAMPYVKGQVFDPKDLCLGFFQGC